MASTSSQLVTLRKHRDSRRIAAAAPPLTRDSPRGAFCPQISNSPAFTFLEELLSAGKLTTAQVQLYRSKYSKLHDVVLKTYENEKNLLKKAKELNKDLSGERAKLEKVAAATQEDSETIAAPSRASRARRSGRC